MNILVSGSLAYDRIMNFGGFFKDHILPDKIHTLNVSFYVHTFRQSYGGTAGNIAYSLALLGERPTVLAAYGHDFGEYGRWCRKHHVNLSHARHIDKTTTASAYIITDKSDNQISGFFPGAMQYPNGLVPRKYLGKKSLALVSPGNLVDMKRYPALYKKTKTPYLYDPGQQIPMLSKNDLLKGIRGAYALISNDYELALITRKTGLSLKKILAFTGMVVTTLGAKGDVITTRTERHVIPPGKPKNTSDPTGAGDAFRAGFIKGLTLGLPLPKAGRLGNIVAIYTVEQYGTQTHHFTWPEVVRRYRQNYKESL